MQPARSMKGKAPTYQPGDVILDVYVVERVLGTGGFNDVYLARHKFLPRKYAVKVMRESVARTTGDLERLRSRVEREAIVLAKFDHPNLPTLHDMRLDRDAPVLVLEYLRGRDLAEVLDHMGQLSIQDALYVGIEVAKPLYIAHRRGIVHRDIKPENIFCASDEPPEGKALLRLLDFGCSRFQADKKRLTHESAVVGTMYYLAPEALLAENPDHRVDIYALGLVIFECLTGVHPHDLDNRRVPAAEMARRHVHEPAPDVRTVREDVPDRLADLIAKMLKKHPGERISSMDDVYDELWATLSNIKREADRTGTRLPSIFTKRGLELPPPEIIVSSRRRKWSSLKVDPGAFERTAEVSRDITLPRTSVPARTSLPAKASVPVASDAAAAMANSPLPRPQSAMPRPQSEVPFGARDTELGSPLTASPFMDSAPRTEQNGPPTGEPPPTRQSSPPIGLPNGGAPNGGPPNGGQLPYAQTEESQQLRLGIRKTEPMGPEGVQAYLEPTPRAEPAPSTLVAGATPEDPNESATKIAARMRQLGNGDANPGTQELLERGLAHASPEVRREAASALAKVGGPLSIGAIDRALASEPHEAAKGAMRRALDLLRFDDQNRVFEAAAQQPLDPIQAALREDDPTEHEVLRAGRLARIALGAPSGTDRNEALLRLQSISVAYVDRVRTGLNVMEPTQPHENEQQVEQNRLACLVRLRTSGIDRFLLSVAVRAAVFGASDMMRITAMRILAEEGDSRHASVLARIAGTKGNAIALRHSAKESLAAVQARPERALPEVLPTPDDQHGQTEGAALPGAPAQAPSPARPIAQAGARPPRTLAEGAFVPSPQTQRLPSQPPPKTPLLRRQDIMAVLAATLVVALMGLAYYLIKLR